jgi:monothiol glutaredoxin
MIVTDDQIREELLAAISENRVMLFMKGTPDAPMCGFSAQTVRCLEQSGARYGAMDILPDPRIRQVLSAHSGWPTIPQLFVDGELVGGCDIITELYESGELQQLVAPAA